MKAIDLFAGCGGLSLGFIKDGYTIEKAVEFNPRIAATYQKNHPEVEVIMDDIRHIDRSDVFKRGDADVIIGGPPCQGFSMAGARIREGFMGDPRNFLFKHYFNVVKTVKPKAFVMENVKGIQTMQNGEIFNEIKSIFQNAKLLDGEPYHLYTRVVKAVDFGIPQKRERMIVIGTTKNVKDFDVLWNQTRDDIQKDYPTYFDRVSVYDAIGNLPNPTSDGVITNQKPETDYQRYLASDKKTITNHIETKHSKLAIQRMHRVGNGENFTVLHELTPREAARIQSFPDDFVFYGNKTSICKQIGNAVPPKISYFLARLMDKILEEPEEE